MWGMLLAIPAFWLGWLLGKRRRPLPPEPVLTEQDKQALRDFERFMRYDGFID